MDNNINGKQFYVNKSSSNMWIALIVIGSLGLLMSIAVGSTGGGSLLLPVILGIINLSNKDKPILVFNKEHAVYKASPIAGALPFKYSSITNIETLEKKIVIGLENAKRPVTIPLSSFNSEDREDIKSTFKTLLNIGENIGENNGE